jgi:ubiquinone/menaquinone biosynthesis C-methylase UbiE
MKHNERVREEFTRQGKAFRDSPALAAGEITDRIASALGSGHGRILDVACGPGVLLPTLSTCAGTVVGVDLTLRSLQLARDARTPGSCLLVRGLSEHLPFRSDSFDAAVLRLAPHHFLEPGAALTSARSVLRPGGLLVVLDALSKGPGNPAGLDLSSEGDELWFTYHWGLFAAIAR